MKRLVPIAVLFALAVTACFVEVVETGSSGESGTASETASAAGPTEDDGEDDGDDDSEDGDDEVMCGDGVRTAAELCDGEDLDDMTCADLGFEAGTLACASDCTFDVSACEGAPGCGDGMIGEGEECDGEDLNGRTCDAFEEFSGGELACNPDCTYDTSGCVSE